MAYRLLTSAHKVEKYFLQGVVHGRFTRNEVKNYLLPFTINR